MAYKPRPGERKHRRLIGEALAIAELAEQDLVRLAAAAKNDPTKVAVLGIENRVLSIEVLLHEMMEIARGDV